MVSSSSFRGLRYGGAADPRVTVTDAGISGNDGSTRTWRFAKYPNAGSPIPIGRWAEAQLIIAEIDGGSSAVQIIDELHRRAGLALYSVTSPGATANEILAQVYEERRRELFLEGHRLNDRNRLQVPLSPAVGTSYAPQKGGQYGADRCFPLPDVERFNNPSITP